MRLGVRFLFSILAIGLSILACNIPAFNRAAWENLTRPAPTQTAPIQSPAPLNPATQDTTRVAETVIAQITQAAGSETPSSPITPTYATPIGPYVCNWAGFISDVSYPDDSQVFVGDGFVKTWQMKNLGTCTWTSEYRLVFDQGDRMGAPSQVKLTNVDVPPNTLANISVSLKAPDKPGAYQGFFKMKADDGSIFGIGPQADGSFWVRIYAVSTNPGQVGDMYGSMDIRLPSFSVDPSSVPLGSPVTVSFTIRNKGNASAGHFKIGWWSGEGGINPQCTWDVPALEADQTIGPLSCKYMYKKNGTYNSQLTIDSGDEIAESNESNNSEIIVVKIHMK